jgi:hypothetical protein
MKYSRSAAPLMQSNVCTGVIKRLQQQWSCRIVAADDNRDNKEKRPREGGLSV